MIKLIRLLSKNCFEKINTYLGKNEVSTLQLHPSFKRLKEYKEDNNYKGNTVKNIADRVFVKIKFTNKLSLFSVLTMGYTVTSITFPKMKCLS